MKFSMMTYTMARQGWKVDAIVRCAAELGFDGIDWVTTYGESPALLRKMSEDAGLPVAAHTFFLRDVQNASGDGVEEARRSLDDAVALGAPVVMIPTPGIAGIIDRGESRRLWIEALAKIMPYFRAAGVTLSVENFPGETSPFVTAADFFEAKKAVPELKLTFDNGNAGSGEEPCDSLARSVSDVVHVHLKDWQRVDREQEGFRKMLDGRYYRPALVGEGVIDSRATLTILKNFGYQGYVNIEYEGNDIPADEAMKRVLNRLR